MKGNMVKKFLSTKSVMAAAATAFIALGTLAPVLADSTATTYDYTAGVTQATSDLGASVTANALKLVLALTPFVIFGFIWRKLKSLKSAA